MILEPLWDDFNNQFGLKEISINHGYMVKIWWILDNFFCNRKDTWFQMLVSGLRDIVFKDLAVHMQDPEARRIFRGFIKLADELNRGGRRLFVYEKNRRFLESSSDKFAVVTLVVSSYTNLQALLAAAQVPTGEGGKVITHLINK